MKGSAPGPERDTSRTFDDPDAGGYDEAALLVDLPERGLARGEVGRVVGGAASPSVTVEFPALGGGALRVDLAAESVLMLRPRGAAGAARAAAPARAPLGAAPGPAEFLAAVLDTLDVGVLACDARGRLVVSNRAAHLLAPTRGTGRDASHPHAELRSSDDKPMPPERHPLLRALAGETVRRDEFFAVAPDGEYRVVVADGHAIEGAGGERLGAVVSLEDVTERRKFEERLQQSQKMEAVGRLAGGVAHDFNNLLTIIRGYSDITLKRLAPGDRSRETLEEVSRAAERAADLTRQLLSFSRKEAIRSETFDLNGVVERTERMLRRLIGEHITIKTFTTYEPALVSADVGQIEQVIVNLAVNARDAMPRGGILTFELETIEVGDEPMRADVAMRPGEYVVLSVTDNGEGMDKATVARAFEPFFTTKERGQGTGLGLATVYGIVRQFGGYVWAYSEPGHGSTFKVYLPRAAGHGGLARGRVEEEASNGGSETILLVEDEESVRRLARETLEQAGYTVVEARDGIDALGVCARHEGEIDLVVTDVVMPRLGGPELAERLAVTRPTTRVLFISGYVDDRLGARGEIGEDVDLMLKPFSPSGLARRVRSILDAAR